MPRTLELQTVSRSTDATRAGFPIHHLDFLLRFHGQIAKTITGFPQPPWLALGVCDWQVEEKLGGNLTGTARTVQSILC